MRVTAVVGSYRRGGVIESAVDAILDSAREHGADIHKVNLLDVQVEFCTNCRACTQEPGPERGECPIDDEMGDILDQIEDSDAFVLASPMNFGTVTALMKRFIERLICYGYWPWGELPKERRKEKARRAVLVASCAAPGWIARWTTDIVKVMKKPARLLGAGKVHVLFIGSAAREKQAELTEKHRKKARKLGKKLAAS
jgi:putative NADPH-quinone reductase